jgi:glycosyltransferase involved in cell wall biosynthesis
MTPPTTMSASQKRSKAAISKQERELTNMKTLSVAMITYNEEIILDRTLSALGFADEIVIVDSGSTDNTLEIAKKHNAKIITSTWPGYGKQKNHAINECSGDWILVLDADEVITPDLGDRIMRSLDDSNVTYRLARKARFMGKLIRYGDWSHDTVLRLFQKGHAYYDNSAVHEQLLTEDPIMLTLKGHLEHYTVHSLEQAHHKMKTYSDLSAKMRIEAGKKSTVLDAWLHGTWTFIRGYIFKLGFLDGKAGVQISWLCTQGSFYKYAKAYEMANKA